MENKQLDEQKTKHEVETNSNPIETNAYEDFNIVSSFYSIYDYYTKEQLIQYISNPMFYHNQLMNVSEKMYDRCGIYGQTISKMVSSPSLDFVVIPSNINEKSKELMNKAYSIFNNKINHKLSTRDSLFNSLLYGEYVAILRDTKKRKADRPKEYSTGANIEGVGYIDNVMLQPLDLKYCRFEGFANGDYVVSFDMQYFDLFKDSGLVGEIRNYPKEFILGYNAYKKDSSKRWMLLPQETTFAYKYRGAINESHGRPLGLFAMLDMLFAEDYTDSQRNNMYENSSTIRWMKLPEGKDKGTCSLNIEQQNNQYNAFKSAVKASDTSRKNKLGGTTTLKLAPNTEIGKLENDDTFLKDTLSEENNTSIATSLGFALSALNGAGEGASYSTLQVNIDLMLAEVFSMLEQISFQYSKLINNYLQTSDEERLDFVYLNTSTLNADSQYERFKDLYMTSGGSRIYMYSSVCGNASLYMKLMEFEKSENYDEKFPPHITSYTASDNADNSNSDGNLGGRPPKKDSELSPEGVQTKTNGGNKQKKLSNK